MTALSHYHFIWYVYSMDTHTWTARMLCNPTSHSSHRARSVKGAIRAARRDLNAQKRISEHRLKEIEEKLRAVDSIAKEEAEQDE